MSKELEVFIAMNIQTLGFDILWCRTLTGFGERCSLILQDRDEYMYMWLSTFLSARI